LNGSHSIEEEGLRREIVEVDGGKASSRGKRQTDLPQRRRGRSGSKEGRFADLRFEISEGGEHQRLICRDDARKTAESNAKAAELKLCATENESSCAVITFGNYGDIRR
jgi:hypothetical protein